jgi:transposase
MREAKLPLFTATRETLYANHLVSLMARLEKLQQSYVLALRAFHESEELLGISVSKVGTTLIKQFRKTIQEVEDEIQQRAPERTALVSERPGVSAHAAAVLMTHLNGKHFAHRDQLVAYVGLDVQVIQSGTFRGRGKLSKRGNSYIRKVLHQIAWGLKQHDPFYRALFKKMREVDKRPYKEALTIIARKFLRWLHAHILNYPQALVVKSL